MFQLPTTSLARPPASKPIAILEWICGGGLLDTPLDQIPPSLIREGQAMLLTIVKGLAAAADNERLELIVPIDSRLFNEQTLHTLAACAQIVDMTRQRSCDCLQTWIAWAKDSQCSWLIAPELNDRLLQVAQRLRAAGIGLLNCDEVFLRNTSNKLRTAQLLQNAGIPHPPTGYLNAIDARWLDQATQWVFDETKNGDLRHLDARWVIKPADGAGCEGLQIVDRDGLLRIKQALATTDYQRAPQVTAASLLVQPMLRGLAASCSAVIDHSGYAHWLPLVSQDMVEVDLQTSDLPKNWPNSTTLRYAGCTYPAPSLPTIAPHELLNGAIRAMQGKPLGWVGIDLLFDPRHERWWVIEINPRCTSSLVGLAAAYDGNLIVDIMGLQTGIASRLAGGFSSCNFLIDS
jgi:predicted ATP-grasp superfamily ATP-dependent carboligase